MFPPPREEFFMEEKRPLLSEELKAKIFSLMPLIISLFVILLIGLSFIGNFYEIRLKENGQKFYSYYKLIDLLLHNPAGVGVQVFYLFTYIIFPFIACIFLFFKKINHNFVVISLLLFLLSGVVSIVAKDVFIYVLSQGFDLAYNVNDLYIWSVLPTIGYFVASLLTLSLLANSMDFTVSDITEMGVLVAIALGLNFIKVMPLPTGGSINLQVLPLFVLSLRRGPLKGFIGCGIVYGIISCLTDGYGFAFFPFDYLIGFGSSCVLGFFTPFIFSLKQKNYNIKGEIFLLVGGLLASFLRLVGGCISSMVFYSYSLLAALEYNAAYVLISGGISIALVMALYGPIVKVNRRFPVTRAQELEEE